MSVANIALARLLLEKIDAYACKAYDARSYSGIDKTMDIPATWWVYRNVFSVEHCLRTCETHRKIVEGYLETAEIQQYLSDKAHRGERFTDQEIRDGLNSGREEIALFAVIEHLAHLYSIEGPTG